MFPDASVDWPEDDEHAEDCVPVWYVETGTARAGPLSSLQLAYAAKHGLIARSSSIWREGLPSWVPIVEVAGLLPAELAPPVVAAPSRADVAPPPAVTNSFYEAYRARFGLQSDSSGATAAGRDAAVGHVSRAPSRHATPEIGGSDPRRAAVGEALSELPWRTRPSALAKPSRGESGAGDGLDRASLVSRAGRCGGHLVESTPVTSLVVNEADEAHTMTRRTADAIAMQIVILLERHGINTLDDLASDERLGRLSALAFDALPGSLRLPITHTLGRDFVEQRIVDVLLTIRASISPDTRAEDLRRITLAQAPEIASRIDAALASAVGNVGSFVNGSWNTALGALRRAGSSAPLQLRGLRQGSAGST